MSIALTLYAMSMTFWLGYCVADHKAQPVSAFLCIPVWPIAIPAVWLWDRLVRR